MATSKSHDFTLPAVFVLANGQRVCIETERDMRLLPKDVAFELVRSDELGATYREVEWKREN